MPMNAVYRGPDELPGTIPIFPLAGALLLPYLAWVSFAAYLNAGIWRLNRA